MTIDFEALLVNGDDFVAEKFRLKYITRKIFDDPVRAKFYIDVSWPIDYGICGQGVR